jgi:hypothetical protein
MAPLFSTKDDPDVLVWMNNVAGLLQGQSKYREAEERSRLTAPIGIEP